MVVISTGVSYLFITTVDELEEAAELGGPRMTRAGAGEGDG